MYEFLSRSELCGYKSIWRYVNWFRIRVMIGIIKIIGMMEGDVSNSIFYYIVSGVFIYSFFILRMWRIGVVKRIEFDYEKAIILPQCLKSLVVGFIIFLEIFFINKVMFSGFPWRSNVKDICEIKSNWIGMIVFIYESIYLNYMYEQEFLNDIGSNIVFIVWNIFVIVFVGTMFFPGGLIGIQGKNEYFKVCMIVLLLQSACVLMYCFHIGRISKVF